MKTAEATPISKGSQSAQARTGAELVEGYEMLKREHGEIVVQAWMAVLPREEWLALMEARRAKK
jgi:hypothetical protein